LNDIPLGILYAILGLLILLSGFFSSSETGMMSLNRYRLKHLQKSNHRGAIRAGKLLDRPDRLIGIILIGNNLVNIFASTIAAVIAMRLWGNAGLAIAPILLTMVILIFAEVTPKTIAALHPEKVAFPASWVLRPLLKLFYPAVWLVNYLSNALVRLFGVDPEKGHQDNLSTEELRTVVDDESTDIPERHQGMLLNILDLEKVTVNDIMIPRNEVVGLDLDDDLPDLLEQIRNTQHTRVPIYHGKINDVIGILHMRNVSRFMQQGDTAVTKEAIREQSREPYFVPESTPLHTQLLNFQKEKRRIALVVDEYGEVQGIVTLEDILEEIVGDFTTNVAEEEEELIREQNGSYILDGTAPIREINQELGWDLPTDGPKTINGLLTEALESIPDTIVCCQVGGYYFEILSVKDNVIHSARAWEAPSAEEGNSEEP